jgi:hypothetical protein
MSSLNGGVLSYIDIVLPVSETLRTPEPPLFNPGTGDEDSPSGLLNDELVGETRGTVDEGAFGDVSMFGNGLHGEIGAGKPSLDVILDLHLPPNPIGAADEVLRQPVGEDEGKGDIHVVVEDGVVILQHVVEVDVEEVVSRNDPPPAEVDFPCIAANDTEVGFPSLGKGKHSGKEAAREPTHFHRTTPVIRRYSKKRLHK